MSHKIGLATVCLHISVVLYIIIGLVILHLVDDDSLLLVAVGMLIFCLALAGGIEFVVFGLRGRKFWAWVAGLCIFGIYVPSLFFPLGALGLWGLLDSGSRSQFGVGSNASRV